MNRTGKLIFRISMFDICLDATFLDFQVPRFPKSGPGLGLGPGGPSGGSSGEPWAPSLSVSLVGASKLVNGPTKEDRQNSCMFLHFFRPIEKIAFNGTKRGQVDLFLLIQNLLTFWAEFGVRVFFFDDLEPIFLDFQVPRSQNSQSSGFPGSHPALSGWEEPFHQLTSWCW